MLLCCFDFLCYFCVAVDMFSERINKHSLLHLRHCTQKNNAKQLTIEGPLALKSLTEILNPCNWCENHRSACDLQAPCTLDATKWSQVPFCCMWRHALLVAYSVNSPVATTGFARPNLLRFWRRVWCAWGLKSESSRNGCRNITPLRSPEGNTGK